MYRDARLRAVHRDQNQRLLAEHETGSAPEKMHVDHRGAGRERPRPLRHGWNVAAGIGHLAQAAQLAKPSRIFSCGRLRPMKMMRLWRFSSCLQGR